MKRTPFFLASLIVALAAEPSAGQYAPARAAEIVERTQVVRLAPDLGHLSGGEQAAVAKLLQVGEIFQAVYEDQRHKDALASVAALRRGGTAEDRTFLQVYRLFQGPIAVTPDNRREPFLAVEDAPPGKNVYPWDLTRAELDGYLAAHPESAAELRDLRAVVRRADAPSLARDLAALRAHPGLEFLHPGLRARLERLAQGPDRAVLYALPYSVAWADEMVRASELLFEAAALVEGDDAEFAGYLRNRARDLLSDDYESGDAAWVTGRFGHLNAQIGAYEVYDDELLGTRAFYSLSLLAARDQETAALRAGMQGLQAIEDALPYARHKRVREDIPVGIYDVVADFGQARGGNTATILPNDALYARRYGRTILLRANIMQAPEVFAGGRALWRAAVAPAFAEDLTAAANFDRTLWHEVGHYLGVDRTGDGRDLDAALGTDASLLEEMKADLVSLFAGEELRRRGFYDDAGLRGLYAGGVYRTLQTVRPRREQPYQTMQLMQFNWMLERGVIRLDPATAALTIDYAGYHATIADLLREVLALQDRGDPGASEAFVARWSRWDERVHGALAARMRGGPQGFRYRMFTYAALGE